MLKDTKKIKENTYIDDIDLIDYQIELEEIPEINLLEDSTVLGVHEEFIKQYGNLTPKEIAEEVEKAVKKYNKNYKINLEERTKKDKQIITLLEDSFNNCNDKKTKKQLGRLIKGFKNNVKQAESYLKKD